MNIRRIRFSTLMLLACAGAHADVTVQEQASVNVAMIKAHGSSTRAITNDKERSESDFRCEGFMSMFCGKNSSLEIIRIDRNLTMSADTKKKTYMEKPFPTPEQIKAAQEHIAAVVEKMKSCPPPPAAANQPTVDTSKCTMSAPTSSVSTPTDTATFAGHAAHHTIMTMTQSCANPETGDTCDMAYTFDVWSANEELPEMATRKTFTTNYLHAMGLDEQGVLGTPVAFSQFLAPYKDAMKKLAGDSASLQGYPLKTTFRVAMGGPKCKSMAGKTASASGASGGADGNVVTDAGGAAAGAAASASAGVASAAASEAAGKAAGGGAGSAIANSAAGAFASKLISGMFSKKKAPAAPAQNSGSTAEASAPADMFTLAEVAIETTSISAGPIGADRFEMPSDYKKVEPPPEKAFEEPTCPKYGS